MHRSARSGLAKVRFASAFGNHGAWWIQDSQSDSPRQVQIFGSWSGNCHTHAAERDMYTPEAVTQNRHYDVRRRDPRYLLSFPVSLTRLGKPGQPVTHGMTLDLSEGGASAVLCGAPAVGETVHLLMQFSGVPLEALAIVRHSNSTRSGVEFVDLSPAQQQQLEGRIQALQGRSWPWARGSASPR